MPALREFVSGRSTRFCCPILWLATGARILESHPELLKTACWPRMRKRYTHILKGITTAHEPPVRFKKRVPDAIGLIRTVDTVQYANLILISG
jgi:hypothetical protein